jgi:hypothetical protein
LSKTTRAHYADALDTLNASLKASMQRATPWSPVIERI